MLQRKSLSSSLLIVLGNTFTRIKDQTLNIHKNKWNLRILKGNWSGRLILNSLLENINKEIKKEINARF